MRKLLVPLMLAVGCGGPSEAAPPARFVPPPEPVAAAPTPSVDSLPRAEVLATVDAGLGTFLQRVDVEPEVYDGRFEGFRIVGLYPADFWAGVDLAPGDVVTRINGMPIERETQAYEAFESLRSAKELRVSLIREGRPHELVLPIVESESTGAEDPTPAKTPAAPPADAG